MVNTIPDMEGLYKALADLLTAYQATPDSVAKLRDETKRRGSRANLIWRGFQRAKAAETTARKYGYIGVGVISFRDARVATFCRRVNLTVEQ